jgi:hypothetical protein
MVRGILITTNNFVREIEVDPRNYDMEAFDFGTLATLLDRFGSEDGQPVAIMLKGRGAGSGEAYNEYGSVLLSPSGVRDRIFVRGDVLLLWEQLSDGYELTGLPEEVSVPDVEDLVRYWQHR